MTQIDCTSITLLRFLFFAFYKYTKQHIGAKANRDHMVMASVGRRRHIHDTQQFHESLFSLAIQYNFLFTSCYEYIASTMQFAYCKYGMQFYWSILLAFHLRDCECTFVISVLILTPLLAFHTSFTDRSNLDATNDGQNF